MNVKQSLNLWKIEAGYQGLLCLLMKWWRVVITSPQLSQGKREGADLHDIDHPERQHLAMFH